MTVREVYESLDAAILSDWIVSGRQEDLHLEFKTLTASPDLSRDDRRNLAKAISGFANSDGGIVVWGIDCRKSPSEADVAAALSPLAQAPAVLSKLQTHTGDATVPIVDGVHHRLIRVDTEAHVVATFVPASLGGPHMAMLGEGGYYKRSGDSFYQMEHFDIADMFGRRARPEVQVSLSLGTGSASSAGVGRRSAELRLVDDAVVVPGQQLLDLARTRMNESFPGG